MRSSDGGGISIFNSLVSRDQRQRRPPQQSAPQQRRRRHLRRLLVLRQGPQQRHRRQPWRRRRRRPLRRRPGAPLRQARSIPIPSAEEFFVEVTGNRFFGNTNPSRNSGATRITMESRGRVTGNVAALNNGFYLQRSELEVDRQHDPRRHAAHRDQGGA